MPVPAAPALLDPATLPAGQQERRDRIVRAAVALLERGEYDAIQMRDVAREAGVALATIYRYFTSKEHLYAAALVEWASGFPTPGRAASTDAASYEERVRAVMRRAIGAL